jgi:hypothetical protein
MSAHGLTLLGLLLAAAAFYLLGFTLGAAVFIVIGVAFELSFWIRLFRKRPK